MIKPFLATALILACSILGLAQSQRSSGIIPEPQSISYSQGTPLKLPKQISYQLPKGLEQNPALRAQLKSVFGNHPLHPSTKKAFLQLSLDKRVQGNEAYKLRTDSRGGVRISASTASGLRYGLESLRQLIQSDGSLPFVQIEDSPRFGYRGLMLDVSRHFFPTSYIKDLLSEMARVKLNRFHWHLVDGAGWRMQSFKYPLLTEKAAYRTESDWDKWWHGGDRRFTTKDDPQGYGGYYTQQEIKEVVAHAAKLGITVIPEIELPGHSTELFHAYRDLICPTATAQDATDVCIGNEEVFTFFQNILDETMALFPSKYIHIGGDEAAMNHWGKCPRCQKRMKDEGLKDLHELQSYMIRRIEKYLNSKGRKLIGWDEILMGGLAPDATVMSWRGESGGIAAAKAGHDVIMTPNDRLYLDYYQSEAIDEPRAIGGYVTLEKVYTYDPTPASLSDKEKKHVLGVQANLWTEYVYTPEHVSYMYFPRALALAEVGWTQKERKDYESFRHRATSYIKGIKERGHGVYPMTGLTAIQHYNASKGEQELRLLAERSDVDVRIAYGSSPTATDRKVGSQDTIRTTQEGKVEIHANVFKDGKKLLAHDRIYRLDKHKGLSAKAHYHSKWNERYVANKDRTLIDGQWGTPTYLDGRWQGFTEDMDVVLELEREQEIKSIDMTFMAEREQWVYMPKTVEVLISQDGKTYTSLDVLTPKTRDDEPRPVFENFAFGTSQRAKFVRVKATIGRSEGHFIFCDEVVIH